MQQHAVSKTLFQQNIPDVNCCVVWNNVDLYKVVCVCACMRACMCVSLSEYLVFILYYFQRFNEILDETQQQQQAFTDITE